MAAAITPPLVVPMHYDPSFKVDTRLHEPLLTSGSPPSEGDIVIEIMTICSQMDLVCQKELYMKQPARMVRRRASNNFLNKATVQLDRLENVLSRSRYSRMSISDYLKQTGLHKVYPRVADYVSKPDQLSFSMESKQSLEGHFKQLALLNKLMAIARQINSDVCNLTNHKYMAHQIALLYGCLNTCTEVKSLAYYRKSIEDNFKYIKSHLNTEDDSTSELLPQHKEWLLNITNGVVNTILSFPSEMTGEILQTAYTLSKSS